ncbi:MAG: hypothetical protein LiPW15_795 [Parcubacteria group bacterium LiPW_15]|nr:MAG: hypothetical protein LiPW15_795 [Parcubacteria group bacterium LiPW_15]
MPANFANSQDLVEVEQIKDSTLVLKDGSLRQILMVSGINFALKSEEEQNAISGSYANFLNSIDFGIQIIVHSRKINIEKYLTDLDQKKAAEQSPLLQNQIGEYREFVRQFVEENAIMSKSFLAVVPWQSVSFSGAASSLGGMLPFGKKKLSTEQQKVSDTAKNENFAKDIQQLSQRVAQVVDGLSAIGLDVVLLNDEQLAELFYNFYNPETTEKENINLPKEK